MLGKALRLIEAAKKEEQEGQASQDHIRPKNPFGKPWGLQVDGDLWEQAWIAVKKRGAHNQKLRKVKGHADDDDVAAARATKEDQVGNDRSDTNADKGVLCIHGPGLVTLAKWLAERHKAYKQLIARLHKFIVGMTKAVKEERLKRSKVDQARLGYDPEKWIKANGIIRSEELEEGTYRELLMPPPVKGKHKYSFCQDQYEQVRHFLRSRRWAHAHLESTAGGVTWLELFTLFDLRGVRTIKGQHIKDTAATERARIRKSKGRHVEAKGGRRKGNLILTSAVVKPTLDEEMKRFKAIARYITSHDLPTIKANGSGLNRGRR